MATDTTQNPTPENNLQTGGMNPQDLLTSIVQKQLQDSGMVSSTPSIIDTNISNAIAGVKAGNAASDLSVTSAYDRAIAASKTEQGQSIQNNLEGRTGFATNMVALRSLVDTTDANLKDLQQRKEEALMNNDATAAGKIADLQLQAITFKQNALQNVFSNALGMANYGIQSANEARLSKQQTFQEKSTISDIALKYGLTVSPGDTIDSITTKAMPFASAEEKASLAKIQSDIAVNNAQAARYIQDGIDAKNFNLDAAIKAAIANPAVLGSIKDSNQLIQVVNGIETSNKNSVTSQIQSSIDNGTYKTKDAAIADITASTAGNNPTMNPAYLPDAIDYINKNWKEPTVTSATDNGKINIKLSDFINTGAVGQLNPLDVASWLKKNFSVGL